MWRWNAAMSVPELKARPRPRDDYSSDGVVEFDAVQSVHNSRNQLVAKGVQFLGSVQRKDRDGAPVLTQEAGRDCCSVLSIGPHSVARYHFPN
jgi:hypothetical protein